MHCVEYQYENEDVKKLRQHPLNSASMNVSLGCNL